MDRNEARRRAEIMMAYADGKEIQVRQIRSKSAFGSPWQDLVDPVNPGFKFIDVDYRVKPKVKSSVHNVYMTIGGEIYMQDERPSLAYFGSRKVGEIKIIMEEGKMIDVKIIDD